MYYASKQLNAIIDSKSSRVFSGTKLARFENGIKFLLRKFLLKAMISSIPWMSLQLLVICWYISISLPLNCSRLRWIKNVIDPHSSAQVTCSFLLVLFLSALAPDSFWLARPNVKSLKEAVIEPKTCPSCPDTSPSLTLIKISLAFYRGSL